LEGTKQGTEPRSPSGASARRIERRQRERSSTGLLLEQEKLRILKTEEDFGKAAQGKKKIPRFHRLQGGVSSKSNRRKVLENRIIRSFHLV